MQEFNSVFGLKPLEKEIYLRLFEKKDSSVKDLTKITGISQAKIYNILSILEEKSLVCLHPAKTGKTQIYNALNPETIKQKQEAYLRDLEDKSRSLITNLQEKFDRLHSRGVCQVKPTHFLITEKEKAISKIKEYISKAQREILLIGVPLWLVDELFELLSFAQKELACNIDIYIPEFETIPSQFKKMECFSPKLIKIPHHQLIEVNQKLYFNSEMIIDRTYMVAISYNEEFDIVVNAFSGHNCISQCILPNLYQNLTPSELETPPAAPKEQRVIEILRQKENPLSKKELSNLTGLSGRQLNKTINSLVDLKKVKISKVKHGKGRPRSEIELLI